MHHDDFQCYHQVTSYLKYTTETSGLPWFPSSPHHMWPSCWLVWSNSIYFVKIALFLQCNSCYMIAVMTESREGGNLVKISWFFRCYSSSSFLYICLVCVHCSSFLDYPEGSELAIMLGWGLMPPKYAGTNWQRHKKTLKNQQPTNEYITIAIPLSCRVLNCCFDQWNQE